jgi:hypothetical protein
MSFTSAQQHYDAMLPEEDPEEHEYSGDIVVGDTLFTYWYGQIVSVMIDDEGTTVPYAEWKGPDSLVAEADVEATELWNAELEEMQNDYY